MPEKIMTRTKIDKLFKKNCNKYLRENNYLGLIVCNLKKRFDAGKLKPIFLKTFINKMKIIWKVKFRLVLFHSYSIIKF